MSFAAAWGVFHWATNGGGRMLVVDATFSRNACCSMEIWLNAASSRADYINLPIQAGKDAQYAIPLDTPYVSRLRLKLGNTPKSYVTVHGIWISHGSTVVSRLPTNQLGSFTGYSAVRAPQRGPSTYMLQQRQAMLDQNVALASDASRAQIVLARIVTNPLSYFAGIILIGALLTGTLGGAIRRPALLLSLAAVVTLVTALPWVLGHFSLPDDVSQAVSYCAYIGVSKPRERVMVDLAAVIALLAPFLAAAVVTRRRGAAQLAPSPPGDLAASSSGGTASSFWNSRWLAVAAVALPIVVMAALLVPDLKAALASAQATTYSDNWDGNNFLFWDWLVHEGLVPMKDFFYPYGLQYLLTIDLPWGAVIRFVNFLLFWTYTIVGTWLVLRRYFRSRALVLRYAVLMGLLLTFALTGFDLGARYATPIGIALLFASLGPGDRWLSWKRLLFMVALLQLALFEVAQAVYALGAVVFIAVAELVLVWREQTRRDAGRWGLESIASVAIPLAAAAVVLAGTGQLSGEAFFYGQLNALTSTYAYPAPVMSWVTNPHNIWGFVFWAYPLTLVLGACSIVTSHGEMRRAYVRTTAIGMIGFMIMQRQVIRDGAETLMWISSIYGLLLWAVVGASRRRLRQSATVAVTLGAITALAVASGGYRAGWSNLRGAPGRVGRSVSALFGDQAAFAAAGRTRFAASRFASFSEWPVVHALQQQQAIRAGGRVWVLGDAPSIMLLLDRPWPYYFNEFYDATPVAYQHKVVQQLEQDSPARVVWNFAPWQMSFDDVPDVVRVPFIFQWALQNLEPQQIVGKTFAILRPRRPGEAIDLSWWRRRIGTTTDMGEIPAAASAGATPCMGGPDCHTFVIVRPKSGQALPASVTVPVTVDGLSFAVQFETAPWAKRYVIDLDRLWFWDAVSSTTPRSVNAAAVAGVDVTVVHRVRGPNTLY